MLEVERRKTEDWELETVVAQQLATNRWRLLRKAWVKHGVRGFAATQVNEGAENAGRVREGEGRVRTVPPPPPPHPPAPPSLRSNASALARLRWAQTPPQPRVPRWGATL